HPPLLLYLYSSFSLQRYGSPQALHSFPTRRSSDLAGQPPKDEVVEAGVIRRCFEAQRPGGPAQSDLRRFGGFDAQVRIADVECRDRKSTRLNSSHVAISYAVFCLKKKK